jgi:hypothetical protein
MKCSQCSYNRACNVLLILTDTGRTASLILSVGTTRPWCYEQYVMLPLRESRSKQIDALCDIGSSFSFGLASSYGYPELSWVLDARMIQQV